MLHVVHVHTACSVREVREGCQMAADVSPSIGGLADARWMAGAFYE